MNSTSRNEVLAQIAQMNDAILALQQQQLELAKTIDIKNSADMMMEISIYNYNKQQEPTPEEVVESSALSSKKVSRVKRSKQADTIVEKVKGKRDIDAGTAAKIDATKAQDVKPAKVAQEKRTTKKPDAEKASEKKEKRTHMGMSYSEVRKEVSNMKAKLNKADQERMAKAGLKNNTWESAIASLEWLTFFFSSEPTNTKCDDKQLPRTQARTREQIIADTTK